MGSDDDLGAVPSSDDTSANHNTRNLQSQLPPRPNVPSSSQYLPNSYPVRQHVKTPSSSQYLPNSDPARQPTKTPPSSQYHSPPNSFPVRQPVKMPSSSQYQP